MKKLTILIIYLMVSVFVNAQTGHLSFLGIPLNGTITAFQEKLARKGVKLDIEASKHLSIPCKVFDGFFAGEKSRIYVYYNERTKIVYRGKAVIANKGLNTAEQKYNDFKKMLGKKYLLMFPEDVDDHLIHDCLFLKGNFERNDGCIGLYIDETQGHYDTYDLYIDYKDRINTELNEKENMEDL